MAKEKKRKRSAEGHGKPDGAHLDTSKPTAIFKPTAGRTHTLSVALPGSIIANAKSHDQKTYLAGIIARALAVFCVDEVVIFDDEPRKQNDSSYGRDDEDQYTAFSDPCHFLAHVLSYLETPAYLRKALFPMHPNLRTAGTLPSLDMPHHLRVNEWSDYREGVTVQSGRGSGGSTSVDVGLPEGRSVLGVQIPPNTRVTLKLHQDSDDGEAIAPTAPREEAGYYWGYTVRRCPSLSTIFTECPFDGGYDVSFGTSERGQTVSKSLIGHIPTYCHMLVVFGGVAGLEAAARSDPELGKMGISANNVSELFDHWINVLPGQGSRTIRTEEAIWLGLMSVRPIVVANGT